MRQPANKIVGIPAPLIAILAQAWPRRHSRAHVDPRTPLSRSRRLGGALHPDRDGGRARHRQSHLHLRSCRTSCPRPTARGRRRIGIMLALGMRIALLFSIFLIVGMVKPVFDLGLTGATRFAWQSQLRDRVFGARPDPDRGRAVPALQGDHRNPPQRRSRRIRFAARQDQQPEVAGLRHARSSRSCCSTWSSRSIRS